MLLPRCCQHQGTLIVYWLCILMLASAQFSKGEESMAPNFKPGAICVARDSKTWTVAKFICYIQVTEVELLRDELGEAVSRPIRRIDLSDSNPSEGDKLFAKLDLCMRSFATKQEAEVFAAKAELEKEVWINDVIRDPGLLTPLSAKTASGDNK